MLKAEAIKQAIKIYELDNFRHFKDVDVHVENLRAKTDQYQNITIVADITIALLDEVQRYKGQEYAMLILADIIRQYNF